MAVIRRALVTGASGFIGQYLCRKLQADGVHVSGLMRTVRQGPWQSVITRVLGDEAVTVDDLRGIDTVFHLAARVHALGEIGENNEAYRRVNLEASCQLMDACVSAGVKRLIYFSSVKAMGEGRESCQDENTQTPPETAYGQSKRAAEKYLLEKAAGCGMHVSIIRPPLVYGPGNKGNLEALLRIMRRRLLPPVDIPGNRRSMVHVSDLVNAAMACASDAKAAGEVFIVTDGLQYSLNDVLGTMYQALGRKRPAWYVPVGLLKIAAWLGDFTGMLLRRRMPLDSDKLEKLTGSACYDSGKIVRVLGLKPEMNLQQAMPEIVEAQCRL